VNTYEIWTVLPENTAYPVMHGTAAGANFREACKRFFSDNPRYCSKTNTFWNCLLFSSVHEIKLTLPANRYKGM